MYNFKDMCAFSDIKIIEQTDMSSINPDYYYMGIWSAFMNDRVDVIKLLIDKNPSYFRREYIINIIFNISCNYGHINVVKMLINNKYIDKYMLYDFIINIRYKLVYIWDISDEVIKNLIKIYRLMYEFLLESVFIRSREKAEALKIDLIYECKWITADYL